jgi:hypothetical protein
MVYALGEMASPSGLTEALEAREAGFLDWENFLQQVSTLAEKPSRPLSPHNLSSSIRNL